MQLSNYPVGIQIKDILLLRDWHEYLNKHENVASFARPKTPVNF